MMLVTRGIKSDQRPAIDQSLSHFPKSRMYFGLVDKSRGPRKNPPNSANNAAQDLSPLLFLPSRCSSSAWRTRSERERPSSLARLASQFANGAGNFSDIVFIFLSRYYRSDRLARLRRGESRPVGALNEFQHSCSGSVISAVKNQSKQKSAMARTPLPARETRALPRIPLNNGTGRPCF